MQNIKKLINHIEDNQEVIQNQLNKNKRLVIYQQKDDYKLMIQENNNIDIFREVN
jgi:hypothetical protein